MSYDASNPKDVKRKKAREARNQREENAALHDLLETKDGRRVIWMMLGMCRLDEVSYNPGLPREQQHTEFFEGIRNVGLQLKARVLSVDHESWSRMQGEALEREARREAGDTAVAEAEKEQ